MLRALHDRQSLTLQELRRAIPDGRPQATLYALERRGLVLHVGTRWTLMAVGEEIVKQQILLQGKSWGLPK